jgi:hypothetical protein
VNWFRRHVLRRALPCFVVMAMSFIAFGAGSYNLFYLYQANLGLLVEYGWQALLDGGAQQLLELVVTTVACMLAYVVFKTCERALVNRLDPAGPFSVQATENSPDEDRSPAG